MRNGGYVFQYVSRRKVEYSVVEKLWRTLLNSVENIRHIFDYWTLSFFDLFCCYAWIFILTCQLTSATINTLSEQNKNGNSTAFNVNKHNVCTSCFQMTQKRDTNSNLYWNSNRCSAICNRIESNRTKPNSNYFSRNAQYPSFHHFADKIRLSIVFM